MLYVLLLWCSGAAGDFKTRHFDVSSAAKESLFSVLNKNYKMVKQSERGT